MSYVCASLPNKGRSSPPQTFGGGSIATCCFNSIALKNLGTGLECRHAGRSGRHCGRGDDVAESGGIEAGVTPRGRS